MYEHFRNELIQKLSGIMSSEQINMVTGCMDSIANNYSIQTKSTQIAVVGRRELMDMIDLYFVIRSQQGMSVNSVKVESYILKKFAMSCTVPIQSITSNHIRSYLYYYQSENDVSQRTLEMYRCVICTFFRWAHVQGYIDRDITSVIKKIKYQRKPRKALSQMQLQDVRSACETDLEKALVETLYSTGCRISQLVNIKQSDIDWVQKQVAVLGKGNKTRTVYINAKAEKAIKIYLLSANNIGGEWLFLNKRGGRKMSKDCAQAIFRNLRNKLGLEKGQLVPHTMRHTMATQAATVCPIQQVQAMLGHSSINTTMIYAETNQQQVKSGHKLSVI